MDIEHRASNHGGAFVVQRQGKRVAELVYVRRNGQVVMNHTWVDPRLRGQGVAGKLMDAAIEAARQEDWSVVPVCSYVVDAFARHPEWSDRLSTEAIG